MADWLYCLYQYVVPQNWCQKCHYIRAKKKMTFLFTLLVMSFQMLSQLEFLRINECFKEPCLHNGKCQPLESGFVCQCLPGFWGIIMVRVMQYKWIAAECELYDESWSGWVIQLVLRPTQILFYNSHSAAIHLPNNGIFIYFFRIILWNQARSMSQRAMFEWRPLPSIDEWIWMPMSSRIFRPKLWGGCVQTHRAGSYTSILYPTLWYNVSPHQNKTKKYFKKITSMHYIY